MCSNNSTPLLFIIIRNLSSFHQCLQIHIKFGVLANYLFSNFPFRINHIFSGITTYSIHHRHIRFTYIAYINPRQLMLSYCFFSIYPLYHCSQSLQILFFPCIFHMPFSFREFLLCTIHTSFPRNQALHIYLSEKISQNYFPSKYLQSKFWSEITWFHCFFCFIASQFFLISFSHSLI